MNYDIDINCESYDDGCNICGVSNGELTYCTEMGCEEYGEPYCFSYIRDVTDQVIPEGCQNWFDGCNECEYVESADDYMCTEMGCYPWGRPCCMEFGEGSEID